MLGLPTGPLKIRYPTLGGATPTIGVRGINEHQIAKDRRGGEQTSESN